jgi:putative transposase
MLQTDQVSQFSSHDWQDFLGAHNLIGGLSRRGNCHEDVESVSFFQLLDYE